MPRRRKAKGWSVTYPVTLKAPSSGATVTTVVELTVDWPALALRMGRKAYRNRSGKAVYGPIKARVTGDIPIK